jgi:hypothetical protein
MRRILERRDMIVVAAAGAFVLALACIAIAYAAGWLPLLNRAPQSGQAPPLSSRKLAELKPERLNKLYFSDLNDRALHSLGLRDKADPRLHTIALSALKDQYLQRLHVSDLKSKDLTAEDLKSNVRKPQAPPVVAHANPGTVREQSAGAPAIQPEENRVRSQAAVVPPAPVAKKPVASKPVAEEQTANEPVAKKQVAKPAVRHKRIVRRAPRRVVRRGAHHVARRIIVRRLPILPGIRIYVPYFLLPSY